MLGSESPLKRARFARGVALLALCGLVAPGAWASSAAGADNRGSAARICPVSPQTMSEGAPSSRMLSTLGVLRRPQTAADTLPAPLNPGGGWMFGEGVYVKYVRRARLVAGVAYYIVPVANGLSPQCRPREEVFFATAGPEGHTASGGLSVSEIERGMLTATYWKAGRGVQSGVVPNGVATVTLRYAPRHGLRSAVTVAAVENVYVATAPPAAQGPETPVLPTTVTWRSANGRILKTFHD